MIQCNKCNVQYFGDTKRHLSDGFGEHRRAIEKAIAKQHIDQPTVVSDRFILPALGRRLNVTWQFQSLGRVVRKPVNVNQGLKVNCSIILSCLKMIFTSDIWCILRILELKTEGQTM